MTREDVLLEFGAAKEYVRDLEYERNAVFRTGRAWPQERQDELDRAKARRSELARQATQMSMRERDA